MPKKADKTVQIDGSLSRHFCFYEYDDGKRRLFLVSRAIVGKLYLLYTGSRQRISALKKEVFVSKRTFLFASK